MKHKHEKTNQQKELSHTRRILFLASMALDVAKRRIDSTKTELCKAYGELAVCQKENVRLKNDLKSCENALRFKERTADSLQIERDAWRKTAELAQKENLSMYEKRNFWRTICTCALVSHLIALALNVIVRYFWK